MSSEIYPALRCFLAPGRLDMNGNRYNMAPEVGMVQIVGGDTCLLDPTDFTTYMEFRPYSVNLPYGSPGYGGYVTATVEFAELPTVEPFDTVEIHFVGFSNADQGGFVSVIPSSLQSTGVIPASYYSPESYQTFFSPTESFQNNVDYVGHTASSDQLPATVVPQHVFARITPFEAAYFDEDYAQPRNVMGMGFYRGGSFYYGLRIVGAYLRITKGVNPDTKRLPFVPQYAFSLFNCGFAVVSASGAESLVNGNDNGIFTWNACALWEDGCVAQIGWGGMVSVMRPTQDYTYSQQVYTEEQLALARMGATDYFVSMIPYYDKGTFIVSRFTQYQPDPDVYEWVSFGEFLEYSKECRLLRRVVLDGDNGTYADYGVLPTQGEVLNDEITFFGGDGNWETSPDSADSEDIFRLDLKTGEFRVLIPEATVQAHSTNSTESWAAAYTSCLCLEPFGEHDILTAAAYSSGDDSAYPDGLFSMWFQRWSYDGDWKGTLGFYWEAPDYAFEDPFDDIGGMVCEENGFLTFYFTGGANPPVQPIKYGGEYDGLQRIKASLIPSDGTVKIVSPSQNIIRFWQTASGIQEGISTYLTRAMKTYTSADIGDTRVRFSS